MKGHHEVLCKRLVGLALILLSLILIWLASTGETLQERDCSALIILLPAGIGALIAKE